MVVKGSRGNVLPPSSICSIVTEGGPLPCLPSQWPNARYTRKPSNGEPWTFHPHSLHSQKFLCVTGGSQELDHGAPVRGRFFMTNAFSWRAGRRRQQVARRTPALRFSHILSASCFPSKLHASCITQQWSTCSTECDAQLGGLQTTAARTSYSSTQACPLTGTGAADGEEGVIQSIRLSCLFCVSSAQESRASLIERWMFRGRSVLTSGWKGASNGNLLLSTKLISPRIQLWPGTSPRPYTFSALLRGTSSSPLRATLLNDCRSLSLTESCSGSVTRESPRHRCCAPQDALVAKCSTCISPAVTLSSSCITRLSQILTPVISQRRHFGGRAGGLKRRKPKKDPGVVIQTGLGRRQEFFWPVEARRTRVPLYQNSRPNLVFDQRFKRFMCMWYSNGIQVFRPFSCRGRKGGRGRHGPPDGLGIGRGSGTWERARAKAVALLRQLREQGKLRNMPKPDICRSGVRGVYFDSEEKLWVATWNEHGLRRFKAFPTTEMGFDAAYQAAVAVRRQKLLENFMFCMQRNRRKSGRLPLK